MHKSLADKISKRIKNARVARVYYKSERDEIRERVAKHFNEAMDCHLLDIASDNVDSKFYGALPSGDQHLYKWDTDYKYRREIVLYQANIFFNYWKHLGKVNNWMEMFEDDQETLNKNHQDLIMRRFEEGVQRAKECKEKIVPEHYKFHDDDFFSTHIDNGCLWIFYGYYTYQRYWMRTVETSAKGMAI